MLTTVAEVAERLGLSRATVYRLVADGRVAATRVSSGAIRILATDEGDSSR
jgi:excisionase family DNA binding protein